ncbi:MAG: dicarboxylate/amino acid:cation symporter [Arcanobacterium sp.]|nr:dicarboxylate/amino acid:cation symporter [Arcanobacterium sp.]
MSDNPVAPARKFPKVFQTLLFWVIVAIIAGSLLGLVLPSWAIVPFATFNDLFGKFLSFVVPLIILGLVTPAIFELGRSGGKWLLVTVGIAYGSTLFAGFGTWALSAAIFPSLLAGQQAPDLAAPENAVSSLLDAGFTMPPVFGVMTALVLSFVLGLGMSAVKAQKMMEIFQEFRRLMLLVITKIIVPLLPVHIFGIFLNMSKSGQFAEVLVALGKVFLFAFVLTVVMIILQYVLAGTIAGRNPFTAIWGMREAYFTALGTSSSAATIPVTVRCTRNNNVSAEIADFVIPLCATIHLAGSTIKIVSFALALQYMMGIEVVASDMVSFIFMLGIIMIAAPGVPGGAITAAQGALQGMLAFTDPMYGIMVAMYVAADSFGTATNVTGDGAIAILVNKLAGGSLGDEAEKSVETASEIATSRV